jgi:hypothetical protein
MDKIYSGLHQDLDVFPNLKARYARITTRPVTVGACLNGAQINTTATNTEESNKILIGQDAGTLSV